ncbi:MAG: hypothetical protein JWR61_1897 [Ferruginibacter sp.]|nr:hypothetical protein [Ferruginibacter sp.]
MFCNETQYGKGLQRKHFFVNNKKRKIKFHKLPYCGNTVKNKGIKNFFFNKLF